MGGRTIVSPRGLASGAASRLRSNTAPNFQQQGEQQNQPPLPASAAAAAGDKKNVLNFGKSPFQAARGGMGQRRPSALNVQEANAGSRFGQPGSGGPLTPGHRGQDSEDNLLTPMPGMSPSNSSSTPTTSGFPFPTTGTTTSSPASSLSTASSSGTLYSATTTQSHHAAHSSATSTTFSSAHSSSLSASSTAATSLAPNGTIDDWPRGPPIRPFDYNVLVKPNADVHAELERVMLELGDWLSGIDAGMTRILGECS